MVGSASVLVNLRYVDGLYGDEVSVGGTRIRIGRSRKKEFMTRLKYFDGMKLYFLFANAIDNAMEGVMHAHTEGEIFNLDIMLPVPETGEVIRHKTRSSPR